MVRGKTEMKRIEDTASRQVTFSKRRNGLLKKAFELSVLCDAQLALIIFSPRHKLYEFSSSGMQETIRRYQRHTTDDAQPSSDTPVIEETIQNLKDEKTSLMKKIETIEASKRKLLGENLTACNIEELKKLENQLQRSISKITARKHLAYTEQIRRLKEKGRKLAAENAKMAEKVTQNFLNSYRLPPFYQKEVKEVKFLK